MTSLWNETATPAAKARSRPLPGGTPAEHRADATIPEPMSFNFGVDNHTPTKRPINRPRLTLKGPLKGSQNRELRH